MPTSYDDTMRKAGDNDAVTEPTQAASEHVPLGRWVVTAEAEGDAVVVVEAASEEDALRIAYEDYLCGIRIDGGIAEWVVTDVRPVPGVVDENPARPNATPNPSFATKRRRLTAKPNNASGSA